jgi:hypothetical protein
MKKLVFVISVYFCLFTGFSFGQTKSITSYDTIVTTRDIVALPTVFENKTSQDISILIFDRNTRKYSQDTIKLGSKSQTEVIDKFEPRIYSIKLCFKDAEYGRIYFKKYIAPGEKATITKKDVAKAIKEKKAFKQQKKEFLQRIIPIKVETKTEIFQIYEEKETIDEGEDNG